MFSPSVSPLNNGGKMRKKKRDDTWIRFSNCAYKRFYRPFNTDKEIDDKIKKMMKALRELRKMKIGRHHLIDKRLDLVQNIALDLQLINQREIEYAFSRRFVKQFNDSKDPKVVKNKQVLREYSNHKAKVINHLKEVN